MHKTPQPPRRKRGRRILLALLLFWGTVACWVAWNLQARGLEDDVLVSDDDTVVYVEDDIISFTPAVDTSGVGLLFYPGALVDPHAYAPLARSVAERGYPVIILELPYRLAPLTVHRSALTTRTLAVISGAEPDTRWIVGGHSKGGKLAAAFAGEHHARISGLLLVGTSHPRRDDLSDLSLDVAKVYGSRDGLASEEEIAQFAVNLPASTRFTRIEGGNHAQFGWYGYQFPDRSAEISRQEQQRQTVEAILDQLHRVSALAERE